MRRTHESPWRVLAATMLGLIAVGGTGMIVGAYASAPEPPPQPAAAPPARQVGGTSIPRPTGPPIALRPSPPVRIDITDIKVRAPMVPLGVGRGGEPATPSVEQAHLTGWYKHGVTPGERGIAVVLGHVDSWRTGPAVFYSLGSLETGRLIEVTRKDGIVAVFRVNGVATFRKDAFPSTEVYGPSDHAELRLVTCGGEYDGKRREYRDNIVVFASLASWRKLTRADRARPLRTHIPDRPGLRRPSASPSTSPSVRRSP